MIDMNEGGIEGVLSHHRVQQRYKVHKAEILIKRSHLEGFGTFGSLPTRLQAAG